ncbi:hypothetical protein JK635_07720 [Neobacillus sp. YIM B02564]|uniref:Uncharacterized protein n=1 Tax=Neobacillus paridis TaxID=2803862 RepID=A0ABS1TLF7_9BACI|nr:hypothetical protein [Neobacillus paridis]MBL4952097.1 hypothetical protein [Neobacillus paridis]
MERPNQGETKKKENTHVVVIGKERKLIKGDFILEKSYYKHAKEYVYKFFVTEKGTYVVNFLVYGLQYFKEGFLYTGSDLKELKRQIDREDFLREFAKTLNVPYPEELEIIDI